jgi:hypothetical protein
VQLGKIIAVDFRWKYSGAGAKNMKPLFILRFFMRRTVQSHSIALIKVIDLLYSTFGLVGMYERGEFHVKMKIWFMYLSIPRYPCTAL